MCADFAVMVPGFTLREHDKTTPGTRARLAFEVCAGLIPGQPMPEYTRRWVITSENWHQENAMTDAEFAQAHPDGKSTFATFRDEAHEYAKSLTDPRAVNWVRVDWIYF
jgi:hypothetical protein